MVDIREKASLLPGSCPHLGLPPTLGVSLLTCPLALTGKGSVSLWDSGDQAQKANELAAAWVRENLADRIRLESAQVGDFFFYETS